MHSKGKLESAEVAFMSECINTGGNRQVSWRGVTTLLKADWQQPTVSLFGYYDQFSEGMKQKVRQLIG